MAMRITSLYSGLDTDSIISELVAAKQTKVDTLKKQQTSLQWKQDAWKSLNTKIFSFYNNTLSDMRMQASFTKKTTSISNSNVASIITSDSAMNSVQSLKVSKLAKSGYMTGGKIETEDGAKVSSSTKVATALGIEAGSTFQITTGGKTKDITVDSSTTMSDLVSQLKSAGVNANFDSATQRLYIGASGSGASSDFNLTASSLEGMEALDKLGLMVYDASAKALYQSYANMDTDTDAKNDAITELANSMAASYKSKYDGLTSQIVAAGEKLESIRTEYSDKYGEGSDLTALASDDDAINTLRETLSTLKAIEDPTEEETAQLNELESKLSYVEKYQSQAAELDKLVSQQVELGSKFEVQENGSVTATADVIAAATTSVEAQIQTAQTKLADWPADGDEVKGAVKMDGQDALIYLNGAKFTSSSNVFEINGLTITCNMETGDEDVTLTTQDDVSGIYDMVKNFMKEYNALIKEFDTLYNAESSKGYDPLTAEEKEAMTESEIEDWEKKIKDSLLRKDSTLGTVSSAFKEIMSAGYTVNGKTMHLFDFGIDKQGYFEAADYEKNVYLIDGDADYSAVKNNDNKLLNMITTDPDTVRDFFNQLSKALYSKTTKLGESIDGYSSTYSVYADKKMKEDYASYTTKITEMEEKLKAYEDKWYSKFSAMETALAKMQSNANAITSLLGGGS